jgi:hypothetical protein
MPPNAEYAPADADELLLAFVRERDMPCPACGYNLRNLSQPVCPECRERLTLSVGQRRQRVELLILAIAPSAFSGIAGLILLLPIVLFGPAPIEAILLDAFGLLSGLVGLGLLLKSDRFLRASWPAQLAFVITTWAIHVTAFTVVLSFA